jgi:hypothetical protein
LCFVFSSEIVDHGGRRGDAMRALARWRHPVASSETLVVPNWAMRPASHRRIRMVVEIVIDLPAFFVASISLLATTIS